MRLWCAASLLLVLLAVAPGQVVSQQAAGGQLLLGRLAGSGWQADDVSVEWRWLEPGGGYFELGVGRLQLDGIAPPMHALRVNCPHVDLAGQRFACADATFEFEIPPLGKQHWQALLEYTAGSGEFTVHARADAYCAGSLMFEARGRSAQWTAAIAGNRLSAECLVRDWGRLLPWPGLTLEGHLSLHGELEQGPGAGPRGRLQVEGTQLALGETQGRVASEALDVRLDARVDGVGDGRQFSATLEASEGAIYVEPVLVDVSREPLSIELRGRYAPDAVSVDRFSYRHGATLQAEGGFRWRPSAAPVPEELQVSLNSSQLDTLFRDYLQPFLVGTQLDDLAAEGRISGELRHDSAGWGVRLRPASVSLLDRRGRFALSGIDGDLAWGEVSEAESHLDWDGGHLLRLALGPSAIHLRSSGQHVALRAAWRQPLVDGALRVDRLALGRTAEGALYADLDAELEAVSLQALSNLFGWPAMAGRVAGRLPSLTLRDRHLEIGGDLRVAAFGGELRVQGLRVDRPLGPLPVLQADISLRDLDLEQVTRTFTIGRIEGRLAGRIDDLELQDWRPVRFDAVLATPPGDRSRKRISQRAINSLSSLGGLSGVLSRSAVRFFDEFGYARLGLRCRLRGAICELGGVEKAPGGYYLVKGGGLPRIDVIGHVTRVDWAELLARLQRAMRDPAIIVE